MDPRNKVYSREEKEKLIWKNKHPDFKSEPGADPKVMVPAAMISEYGSTVFLNSVDERGLERLFKDAVATEASIVRKNIFSHVFDGKYKDLNQAAINQWSSSFEDMRSFADGVKNRMGDKAYNQVMDDIDSFEKKFNAEPKSKVGNSMDFSR